LSINRTILEHNLPWLKVNAQGTDTVNTRVCVRVYVMKWVGLD